MKILQITNKVPWPPIDGGAIAMMDMALNLAEAGAKVTILSINTPKHFIDPATIPPPTNKNLVLKTYFINRPIGLVSILRNFFLSSFPYTLERFIDQGFAERIRQELTENSFDVVQLEGLYLTWYIPLIRRYSQALVSFRAHNIEHEIWERAAGVETSWLRKIYLWVLVKRIRRFKETILDTYDVLVPITERDATRFTELGNSRPVCTIPAGIQGMRGDVSQNGPVGEGIFFLGALDWLPNQEGVDWFLDMVWPQILKVSPGLVFHVAGRNCPLYLQRKWAGYPGVLFHGEVPSAEDYANQFGVMVVPVLSGSGIRVKLLQGMAWGKAIVTTSIGSEGIPAEDGVHMFLADGPQVFAERVLDLCRDSGLRRTMGARARLYVHQNFRNEELVRKLLDCYSGMINKRQGV